VVVGGLGLAWLVWALSDSMRGPESAAVQTSWTSHAVVLSAAQPVARARLTLGQTGAVAPPLELGVAVGVPRSDASPDPSGGPGALLDMPAVRLSVSGANGSRQSCLAPCELMVAGCASCSAVSDVALELVAADRVPGRVTVTVSGGASAYPGGQVPSSTFELLPAPSGGGG
jgi:hypothetical protein